MSSLPSLPESTDIAIVGGGIVGTATAFFLARDTDRDVTLVEKNAIGSGSTGDSSAILRHHYGDQEIYTQMAWWSHKFYREFEERTGEVIAHGESPRVVLDSTESGDTYAEDGHEVLSELGIPVSRLSRAELAERFPMLELDQYDFGITDETAGYSDGTDAAQGFSRAAQAEGATVLTRVEVTDIHTDGESVTAVETTDGTLECEDVLLAAGPWVPELTKMVGVDVPITTSREQVVILEPTPEYVEEFPDLMPTTGFPSGDLYTRPDFGNGILVATHYTMETVDPDRYDQTVDEDVLLDLHDEVASFVPALNDAGILGKYCGVYAMTPDRHFILDQVGPDGCYVAGGFSGHGFKHGPALGRILSDLIEFGTTEFVDAEFFSADRFEQDPSGYEDMAY